MNYFLQSSMPRNSNAFKCYRAIVLIVVFISIVISAAPYVMYYINTDKAVLIQSVEHFFKVVADEIEERVSHRQLYTNILFLEEKRRRLYPVEFLIEQNDTILYRSKYNGVEYAIKRSKKMSDTCSEVEISTILDHENIVKVYDAFFIDKDESYFYVFMEYLPEKLEFVDIDPFDKNEKTKILEVALAVAHAVNYLQDTHYISHNDIKIENVRGIKVDGKVVWKLVDFGIATYLNDLEKPLEIIGTLTYMAPESQIDGIMTHGTDIWLIGMMIYYMDVGGYNIKYSKGLGEWTSASWKIQYDVIMRNVEKSTFKELLSKMLKQNPNMRPTPSRLIEELNDELSKCKRNSS